MSRGIFDDKNLLGWLARQDPHDKYQYDDGEGCLLTQYFRDCGLANACCNSYQVLYRAPSSVIEHGAQDMHVCSLPPAWDEVARLQPWTFGDAHARARAMLT